MYVGRNIVRYRDVLTGHRWKTHIGCLPHQLGGIHLSARRDDLGFTDPLLRRRGRERLLELDREIDVFQQDRLDGDTPFLSCRFDLQISLYDSRIGCSESGTYNLCDLLRETFSVGDHALEDSATDDLAKSGFCHSAL